MTNLLELVRGFKDDLHRGRGLLDHAKFDEAQALLAKYDGLFPKDADLALLRARLAFGQQDFEAASALFAKVLALDPFNVLAIGMQAHSLTKIGQRDAALTLLESARAAKPDDNTLLEYYLPQVLTQRGLPEAIAVLRSEYQRRGSNNKPTAAAEIVRQKALSLFTMDEVRAADPDDLLMLVGDVATDGYNLRSMYAAFEPIGCNCEFGFAQRHRGVEPLALFRWTGVTPANLIRMLDCNLDGYEDPKIYKIDNLTGREYMLVESLFDTLTHTGVSTSDLPADEFLDRVTRRQGFLKRKFLQDAAEGKKIFVYKADHVLGEEEMSALEAQLTRLGVRRILFVQLDKSRPGGTFEVTAEKRAMGYLSQVQPNTKFDEWDRIVVAAHDHFLGRGAIG